MGKEAVQTLEDQGGRVGCNCEERAEGWVEDVWVEVFVEAAEAESCTAADQSHGLDKVGCDTESRAQKAKAAGIDAKLRD